MVGPASGFRNLVGFGPGLNIKASKFELFLQYLLTVVIIHSIRISIILTLMSKKWVCTVCTRSLDPIYMVPYHLKWVKTSWTYSRIRVLFEGWIRNFLESLIRIRFFSRMFDPDRGKTDPDPQTWLQQTRGMGRICFLARYRISGLILTMWGLELGFQIRYQIIHIYTVVRLPFQ